MSYLGILITYIFVNNFIFVRFLGICPFIGVSKSSSSAIGMGIAVTFVTAIASVACTSIYYLLEMLGLEYMKTIAFILVIASLVQLVEMVIKKTAPALYQALGIYLPLITTNCAVLGIALLNIDNSYNVLESFVAGIAAGLGFTMAIILMANVRERLEMTPVRKWFKGVPITFISAGLMALAFMAFDSSLIANLGLA